MQHDPHRLPSTRRRLQQLTQRLAHQSPFATQFDVASYENPAGPVGSMCPFLGSLHATHGFGEGLARSGALWKQRVIMVEWYIHVHVNLL